LRGLVVLLSNIDFVEIKFWHRKISVLSKIGFEWYVYYCEFEKHSFELSFPRENWIKFWPMLEKICRHFYHVIVFNIVCLGCSLSKQRYWKYFSSLSRIIDFWLLYSSLILGVFFVSGFLNKREGAPRPKNTKCL